MDETTKTLIDSITVKYGKPTKMADGRMCSIFYDCARLSPNELARLSAEATGHLAEDTFDVAVGIAYNGILFAASIAGGRQVAILQVDGKFSGPDLKGCKVVVVDDVVHSGNRMLEAAKKITAAGGKVVGFACIIDRSDGKFGSSAQPLWSAFQTNML
jgi:orotate phosphoribosyltransferase